MRSGLFWKLFLLQMLAALALLVGVLAVTRAFSVRHFSAIIEKRDREEVHELAEEMAVAYASTGDLVKAAETIPRLWRWLHVPVLFCQGPDCPPPSRVRRPDEPGEPPERSHPHEFELSHPDEWQGDPFGPPDGPPDEFGLVIAEESPDGPPRITHFRTGDGMVGMRVGMARPLPLQLQDAGGRRLLGVPIDTEAPREAITADGKVVGYLARAPVRGPPELLEFTRLEMRRFMVVGPVSLAVAAAFALLITALIVRPIRQLSGGAAALTRREFATRLPENRRDELGTLAADFNRLAAALEGYDSRQRQWLADISHELRTPVAVLRGELEALLDGLRPADAGAIRSLRQEVGRVEALIGDLQLVSLAESGGLRLNLAQSDLGALVRQSAERFRERLKARGFDLKVEAAKDLTANVDAQRIEQVLANLIENALRHATAPGPVHVVARAEGAQAVLAVADGGPGVPAEALPRLFDRLYRVEAARTRAGGGAGLGLSICKSIVEAHGGTIGAQLSAAGGLEIVIRIPR